MCATTPAFPPTHRPQPQPIKLNTQQVQAPTKLDNQQQQQLDGSLSLTLSSSARPTAATRNFDVDRLALLIAGAALEAARLKAEGKAPAAAATATATLPGLSAATPQSAAVYTPGMGNGVRRLPTVDLSTLDGSFSSNFGGPAASKAATTETPITITGIAVEASEAGAP